jgi:hypothetical protein
MKKGVIFAILLMSVLGFGFSQTGNSWTVTNASTWIEAVNGIRSGGNDKTYTITVNGTVSIPGSTETTFGAVTGITVTMEGSGTLTLSNNGAVLIIGARQTVIAKDVTLRGRTNNGLYPVVGILSGGTFRMEGSASVTGNTVTGDNVGGGVWNNGTFIMEGGTISGNNSEMGGGGVFTGGGGTFTMNGGTISNNTSTNIGGGVYMSGGTFTMQGGTISGNTAMSGGGVYVGGGTFTMQEGCTITRNTASITMEAYRNYNNPSSSGGGVHVNDGTFTMRGGTISSNTASATSSSSDYYSKSYGGGVSVRGGTFTMQGGTISSNTASASTTSSLLTYAYGGGVSNLGTFTMLGGTISGNTATASSHSNGGGVFVSGNGSPPSFTMQSGTITGNTASVSSINSYSESHGGGVCVGGDNESTTNFTIQGNASVTDNTATLGGGVFVAGYKYMAGYFSNTISNSSSTFTMQGDASVSGNTAGRSGGGVYVGQNGTFAMQGNTSVSGNNANYDGGGVSVGGTFNKTGGTIYGENADTNQKNTVVSRIGNAVYESRNGSWRNVTAGPTMNLDSYGFWLNDGDVVTFPSGFAGTYKRSNFDNTLTLTSNIIKSSNSTRIWILQRVSGNAYTFKRADAANTITLTITYNGNLVISGDSGICQDNGNGTWASP